MRGKRRGLLSDMPPWARFGALPVAVVLTAALLAFGVDALAFAGRVHPGVKVGSVDVGRMTPAEARTAIAEHAEERLSAPVSVTFEEREWEVTSEKVGASVDAQRHVDAAMAVGRTGPFLGQLGARAGAWVRPVRIAMKADLDPAKTDPLLDDVAEAVLREPKDADIKMEGTTPKLVPAEVGIELRRDVVEDAMREAFVAEKRDVHAAVGFTPVAVTDEDAAAAMADAERMASGTVAIEHEGQSWEFEGKTIAGWLAFRQVPPATSEAGATGATATAETSEATSSATPTRMILEAFVDSKKVGKSVTPKVGEVGQEPVDAKFAVSGGKVTIVPSKDGTGPDMKALSKEMTIVLKGDGERVVTLRTRRVEPEITTAKAKGMGVKEHISTYTTDYDPGNAPRVNNIHTLAKALDGTLVAPGATFSFNGTIGPRTAAKGYQEAPAIVNGKLVPQLGGGICQVGTTVFNAVFFSGLPVVERRNHSQYISHYPKGRDATVSYGGPDLKFRNDLDTWVLVKTGVTAGTLTVSLYGTDPGYDVSYTTGEFTDIRPHGVSETKDPNLLEGKRVVEDSGVDGKKCVVTRTVKKGEAVVRSDTFTSVYKPKEEVVRIGTKKAPVKAVNPPQ